MVVYGSKRNSLSKLSENILLVVFTNFKQYQTKRKYFTGNQTFGPFLAEKRVFVFGVSSDAKLLLPTQTSLRIVQLVYFLGQKLIFIYVITETPENRVFRRTYHHLVLQKTRNTTSVWSYWPSRLSTMIVYASRGIGK